MALQRIPLKDFRGGLNTRDGQFDLQANESPDLLNVTITALVGTLEVRKGIQKLNNELPTGTVVDHAKQVVFSSGARVLMLSVAGNVWALTGGGELKKLHTGTTGNIWDFELYADAEYKDWVYMLNGTDTPQKWDGAAGATVNWPTTNGEIPDGKTLTVWENRMIITGVAGKGSRIYFSEFADPETTIKEYGFVDIRGPEEDIDVIQDIVVLGARLIVLKRQSVYFVSSPITFLNRRIGSPGVWGRFQTMELEDKLYFFNPQGIFSTGGVTVAMETGSINNLFPDRVNAAALDKVRMMTTRDSYPRLLMAVPLDGSITNNYMIEMIPHINFRRIGGRRYLLLPAFMLHTISADSLARWNPSGHLETIVGSKNNLIQQFFVGTSDEGAEIQAHYQTSWMAIQGEEPFERVRRLNVELSGDCIVDVFEDFETTVRFTGQLPEAPAEEDPLWEGGTWDGGTWGVIAAYRFERVRPETRGRFHSVRFRSVPGGLPFLINVAELVIRGGKEH